MPITALSAAFSAASSTTTGLTGVTGFFADLIDAAGAVGVGALTLVETLVPPIPSEVVLPLAGFLAQQGRLSLLWVLVASTLGSVVGALVFYWLGAALGLPRALRLLSKIPLVDLADLQSASDWFHRHGRGSVLFGRLVPGVRSLISLPAGAQRMSLPWFIGCTTLGSAAWNAILVGLGYGLGTQWARVGGVASTVSNVVVVLVAVVAVAVVVRRSVRRRASARGTARP